MSKFKPTWLCIKQHNQTGLKYFCKTTRNNPHKYNGSGVYWTNHLKKHGYDIVTLWCELFLDEESLISYAMQFSISNNIVESDDWANLKYENGLDGGSLGYSPSIKTRQKISESESGKVVSEQSRMLMSKSATGRKHSAITKQTMSDHRKKEKNAFYGKTHTLVAKSKNSESHHPRAVSVDGVIYPSLYAASIALNIPRQTLNKLADGNQKRSIKYNLNDVRYINN